MELPAITAMTGTANYTARWTDANTLGTGALYDNGASVGIGSANPGEKLDVIGDVYIAAAGQQLAGQL